MLGEIKSSNPVKIARKASIIALSLVSVIFLLVNVAYVAAVPREDIRNSGQLVAALFFHRVFGPVVGNKVLPLMVALSCFGNLVRNYLRQTWLSCLDTFPFRLQWYVLPFTDPTSLRLMGTADSWSG